MAGACSGTKQLSFWQPESREGSKEEGARRRHPSKIHLQ
jgi:hypothetical protein